MKNYAYILLAAFLGIVMLIFFRMDTQEEILCDSNLIIYKKGHRLNLLISYSLSDGLGVAMINGSLLHPDGYINHIDRKVFFSYKTNNEIYSLKSLRSYSITTGSPEETNKLNQFLPDFYLGKDITFDTSIYKQSNSSWIFAAERIPNFVCIKHDGSWGE